ncbi:ribosome-associated translation inhibitor RaiA [Nitrobacter vulgaris]|uniref:hypothetical protein n=1 Tax=Nitrobacter vulgaris TaxID=29421 RepID=UPI00286104D5|nr:hypothetical protein [Nitrobacter vulgaris]MDR6304937.1 ribosome-associated translation inhibitor RaiA [Nitrobacter vulgaris]
MIARKKKFADISTAADIEAALAEYDIATLEASLAGAQQRRTDLLLTGTDPEILAAEGEATKARLALDRAVAAVSELTRRLKEARETEARAAAQKHRDEAVAAVDRVVARIHSEYDSLARAIASLVQEAVAADSAVHAVNDEIFRGGNYESLELVKFVHDHLGWAEKFSSHHKFGGSVSLPAIGTFPGVGDPTRWHEKLGAL